MRDRGPSYKPGFAEHKIPVPFAWFDKVAPWATLVLAIIAWGIVAWKLWP